MKYPQGRADRGFALIIALSLMAFIVLLMLSLSSLTMVELKAEPKGKHLARQNALLGLHVALAQLQETLGPDQRTSARADILQSSADAAPSADRRYWTAVWNTAPDAAGYGERIAWLVSDNVGLNAHQSDAAADDVILVGEGSVNETGQYVRAPRVLIRENEGNFAYWVGDEGIKMRHNLPAEKAGAVTNATIGAPSRYGLSLLADFANTAEPDTQVQLSNALARGQLPFLHALPDGRYKDYFHSVSFNSRSVLADIRSGALRYDLSIAFEDEAIPLPTLPSGTTDLNLLRSYYRLRHDVNAEATRNRITPRVRDGSDHEVHPLVLRFDGNFGFLPSLESGGPALEDDSVTQPSQLLFTMRPTLILANPYDIDLAPADYEFVWEEDPDAAYDVLLSIRFPADTAGSAKTVNVMTDLLKGPLRLHLKDVGFLAGEVKVFTLAEDSKLYDPDAGALMENASNVGNFFYTTSTLGIPAAAFAPAAESPDPVLDWDTPVRVRLNYQGEALRVPASSNFFLRLNGKDALVYESVFSGARYPIGEDAYSGGRTTPMRNLLLNGYMMRYIARPGHLGWGSYPDRGEVTAAGGDQRGWAWVANSNLRSTRIAPLYGKIDDLQWRSHPVFHWYGHATGGSVEGPELDASGLRSTWAGSGSSSSAGMSPGSPDGLNFVSLFHIPRSALLSLGQLQHANASPETGGSYSVGHSWASPFAPFATQDTNHAINEALWDRFFFSGKVGADRLNPRITSLNLEDMPAGFNPDAPEQNAAGLMLEGGFNINSTDVLSWQTLLASLRDRSIDIFESSEGGTRTLAAAELNNPILGTLLPGAGPLDGAEAKDRFNAQWNGFRDLSDDQIRNLAGQIVHQVRRRGPFLSLGQFVNRTLEADGGSGLYAPRMMGALQAAIDNDTEVVVDGVTYQPTGINVHSTDDGVVLNRRVGIDFSGGNRTALPNEVAAEGLSADRGAPGYLTQGDLLTYLGSLISARSDTFVIRSYGDWENAQTGAIEARAWCEAIVQRLPIPVVASADNPLEPDKTADQDMGRRFKVVSFRWLSADEI